ncbi:DUF2637 domain-containing protein [Streptomyces bathyalis]|uniref:DUF2637 domain-containing protein n=1 Tax=Streptomyces bathyalis TaxID=2710756 RepID=A0A7T1T8J7_9ACTN|nr:DUF2637 domain-containing protein [Streptomyces bathyalis]QPP08343.1 DUF2637 domain-containing protein [Streptomyces bathyalis]
MTKNQAERAAILTAGIVIIALTVAAFWLSYAHLADVARQHGLAKSPERAWAWPGTIDLFILAGEVLMFRAALRGAWDGWAFALTAAGSLGSIALNVAGVGTDTLSLDHVVAAVPPTAALLAFGALMRQVHGLVTGTADAPEPVDESVAVVAIERPQPGDPAPEIAPAPAPAEVPSTAVPSPSAAPAVPPALVTHARKLADAHRDKTGEPIGTDVLRVRLGVPASMADAIAAQLA